MADKLKLRDGRIVEVSRVKPAGRTRMMLRLGRGGLVPITRVTRVARQVRRLLVS